MRIFLAEDAHFGQAFCLEYHTSILHPDSQKLVWYIFTYTFTIEISQM